jgi:tetratricopeptide (TPR) repeat protein
MNNCISTKIVSILDCCYSGSATIGKSSNDEVVLGTKLINKGGNQLHQQSGEGKCLLAASLSYQQAFGMQEGGQSVFTHYLIEGLKGAKDAINKQGNITPDSLGKYLYHKVTKVFPNQKPIRKVEASGDIILASYPNLIQNFDPKLQKNYDIKIIINEANDFLKNGEYNKALINYNLIIEQDHNNLAAWNNKGNTYEKLLMYNEAKQCYERILEIDSKDHLTWFNRGNTLLKLKQFEDALECYTAALEINPDESDYLYNRGITLLELGREKEGKACIKKAKNLSK